MHQNHLNITTLLINSGVNVNDIDKDGTSPLILAVENQFNDIINLLISSKLHFNNKLYL